MTKSRKKTKIKPRKDWFSYMLTSRNILKVEIKYFTALFILLY